MSKTYLRWLLELTGLPTASGREGRVASYIRDWAAKRPALEVTADRYGNLTIKPRRKARSRRNFRGRPIYITAHMDHPAFVVERIIDRHTLVAEFRGGVRAEYFKDSPVALYHADGPAQKGKVVGVQEAGASDTMSQDRKNLLRVRFAKPVSAAKGDVMTWDVGPARITRGHLYTPSCDDLGGVAAAISAYDALLKAGTLAKKDIRLLLTRAEEMGFVGAIAAARHGGLPKNARLVCLETSKSYPADSPIGGGPIVRVGDYTSTFNPDLTYRLSQIAAHLVRADKSFKFQRRLMPGGTCESSAFQAYGYISSCLCVPLGNYHNMNEKTRKIDAETISVADFLGLVRLLVAVGQTLDDGAKTPPLVGRLEELFRTRKGLLGEG